MTPKNFKQSAFQLSLLLLHLCFSQLCSLQSVSAQQEIDDEHRAKSMAVLNYVTGWSLDSGGYHPGVYMLLENTSGRDLSGVTIKMQGKFTDIHTLEPSTAKTEFRRTLKPHQQFPIALVAPKDYELPRETNHWPVMECKAMMRVGSVGDEGTEYLLITKIDPVTTTQEDSFQKLNEVTSYNRRESRRPAVSSSSAGADDSHTRPLIAKAERLKTASSVVPQSRSTGLFSQKPLPGLGEDFYLFEKTFGLPVAIDAKKKDYTWAKYKHAASGTEIFVASRERTGKVDLIAFVAPKSEFKSDQALIDDCKLFCGVHQSKLGPLSKSVRYLPSGRLELLSASGPGVKILAMALPENPERPSSYLVMISRLSQEPDDVLRSHQAGCDLLRSLPLGDVPDDRG